MSTLIDNLKGLKELGLVDLKISSSKEMVSQEVGDVLPKDNVNGNGFVPDGSMAFTQIETIKAISI